jgi:hypothetical protein
MRACPPLLMVDPIGTLYSGGSMVAVTVPAKAPKLVELMGE